MFGLGKPKSVAEHEAEGDVARSYHEIRQVLRVSGVNLVFRKLATFRSFPGIWDAARPVAEARAFEDAADRIRADAAHAAGRLGRVGARGRTRLGESQAYQVAKALDLYHYINPKLLVLISALRLALGGEGPGSPGAGSGAELIERGVPPRMYPMEMVSEEPDDPRLRDLFGDIVETLDIPSVNSDYRTLALWPDYLAEAWDGLKPLATSDEHRLASDSLLETSRILARTLPLGVALSRQKIEELGDKAGDVVEMIGTFERILAPLILNVSLIGLDWKETGQLASSPYPAASRTGRGGQRGGPA